MQYPRKEELVIAQTAFDACAVDGVVNVSDLASILEALGQPQELADAEEGVQLAKQYSFDPSPDGKVAWAELRGWLKGGRQFRICQEGETPFEEYDSHE